MSNGDYGGVVTTISDVFAAVGKALYRALYTLESWTIIPAEILMRLWYRLDPRVYSERLRSAPSPPENPTRNRKNMQCWWSTPIHRSPPLPPTY